MKNFFELISEIEVKEGTKVKFQDDVWTYDQKYISWEKDKCYEPLPYHHSEKGWEEVKPSIKKLVGWEAKKYMLTNPGAAIKREEGVYWFSKGFFVSFGAGPEPLAAADAYFFDGSEFEVVEP